MLAYGTPATCSSSENQSTSRFQIPAVPPDPRIRQAKKGSLQAFNELVLLYQDSVYRQALWILKDEAAAEDAAQEAFLLAYRKISTYQGGSFRAWLLKITSNYCLDQIRIAKRRPCQPLLLSNHEGEELEPSWVIDPGDSPEKTVEHSETRAAILQAIRSLPPENQIVVFLVDLQELDYGEAAAVLQVPIGTIKSRLARAREKLREALLKKREMSCDLPGR
jgi:RNA polymerase sigma-70 factor, ECF subfamily